MKHIPLVATVFWLLVLGCTGDNCEGGGKYYLNCNHPYSPNEDAISWTGYNTPEEFDNCFAGYPETIKQHKGDTIRITGWLYASEAIYRMMQDTTSFSIGIMSNPVHDTSEDVGVTVCFDGESLEKLKDNFWEWKDNQMYVIGLVGYWELGMARPGCYHLQPIINAIDINITQ